MGSAEMIWSSGVELGAAGSGAEVVVAGGDGCCDGADTGCRLRDTSNIGVAREEEEEDEEGAWVKAGRRAGVSVTAD